MLLLIEGAERHRRALDLPHMFNQGNHALFVMLGLAALSRALPELPSAADTHARASSHIGTLVRGQYGEEGMHLEHSPYYHVWVYHRLARVIEQGWFSLDAGVE